jgi:hypothetical protein
MVTLSIKVSPAQKARLDTLARRRKTTSSALMRDALDRLAHESAAGGESTCYQLTHDLFENPGKLGASSQGDRSYNKSHLRNFGQKRHR